MKNKSLNRLSGFIILFLIIFAMAGNTAQAKIISKPIPYQSEGFQLEGYLAYDNSYKGKRPGVLVIHEWWGLNDTVRQRVDELAAMGYVAFALDLYGKGKTTTDSKKATHMLRMVQMNVYRWHQRALVGLKVLKKQPQVDPEKIAAIGYGWGGVTLQQQVFKGADIDGAVLFSSFKIPTPEQQKKIKAKILVLQGEENPFLRPDQIADYKKVMEGSGLDWQMVVYSGAKHGFSDPNAAKYNRSDFEYNEAADKQSWSEMNRFLTELFQT